MVAGEKDHAATASFMRIRSQDIGTESVCGLDD
jgi:hypothetical protein